MKTNTKKSLMLFIIIGLITGILAFVDNGFKFYGLPSVILIYLFASLLFREGVAMPSLIPKEEQRPFLVVAAFFFGLGALFVGTLAAVSVSLIFGLIVAVSMWCGGMLFVYLVPYPVSSDKPKQE
jgi:hypothetical protein